MGIISGNGTAVAGLGGAAGYGELALERADASATRIDVSAVFGNGFAFGGGIVSAANLFVSTDGLISFGSPILGLPADPAALSMPFVAAFLADIDTRLDGEGAESGAVWVDIDPLSDVVTITWSDVGFYRRNATLTNTFQIQLFDRGGGGFDIVLRYEAINWTTGDLEGGWGGLGGTAAFIGYDLGTAAAPVTLAASRSPTAQLALAQTLGNTGVAGMWVYTIGATAPPPPRPPPPPPPPPPAGPLLIAGTTGNDTQTGGGLADTLQGSLGADLLNGGAGFDVIDYGGPTAAIADLAQPAQNTGFAAGDRYTGIEGLIGSTLNDDLRGDTAANALDGRAGNDLLSGRDGNDTLSGQTGQDRLLGEAGHDLLLGGDGNDSLYGGTGNDTLDGGVGQDSLQGGDGIDWISYVGATAAVTVDLTTLALNTGAALGDKLVEIEGVTGSGFGDGLWGSIRPDLLEGGGGNDTLFGRAANDHLFGGAGNDLLDGGLGSDSLTGGDGFDTVTYASSVTAIRLDLTTPAQNTGIALGDVLTGIESILGSNLGDTLLGGALADRLDGGAGNDSLTGRAGADLLIGGAGMDTLIGGAGADTLTGGDGFDWVSYLTASTAVLVDLAAPVRNSGDAANDALSGIEGLVGSALNDTLAGDASANSLDGDAGNDLLQGRAGADKLLGGSGNDTLEGGAGNDVLTGGLGFDHASYANAIVGVRADLALPRANSADALGDSFLAIEGLIGSAFNDDLRGDAFSNALGGGAGNDLLQGRGGNDTLLGGDGNDTLDGGYGADRHDGGAGYDWVSYASAIAGQTLDLTDPTRNTYGAKGDTFATVEAFLGSALRDVFSGDAASNHFDGAAGNDTLSGRGGVDSILGGLGNDWLYGGDDADWLQGSAGLDNLFGDAGNDRLEGGDGNDTLTGGAGDDRLTGGLGMDRFVQTGLGLGRDTITDYAAKLGDQLVFTATGATRAQFGVTYAAYTGEGSSASEAVVTHLPSGQVLWVVTDGAAMTDLHLRLGAVVYDLI